MSDQIGFVPVVPFTSYNEYEEMLECLIIEYEDMVLHAVTPRRVACWCGFWQGLSSGVEAHWELYGLDIFLKFTKGLGSDWCYTMNIMVVHALGTAVRIMIQTRMQLGVPMDSDFETHEMIRGLLRCETRRAIAHPYRSPNNMDLFETRNFQKIWKWNDEEDYDEIPIAQWQKMQLAFCMINHGRLGGGLGNSAGKRLGCDMIKLILFKVLE
jgi:hypothetical protein